jgi:acetyltransferase-like isoleucine patch superfamily enzyme
VRAVRCGARGVVQCARRGAVRAAWRGAARCGAARCTRAPRGRTLRIVLRLALARLRSRGRLTTAGRPRLGRRVRFDLAAGALVALGDGCRVGDGCRFHVGAGAVVDVGADARLGERCVIAAHERVAIGAGARLGDDVALIDFDHDVRDVERPVRQQALLTAPILIGDGAVIGAGAGVLRGVTVGSGARVDVRAVVTHDVPAGARAEGVPAHVIDD